MADRRPALYEISLLPGLLSSTAEERVAIAALRSHHVGMAVIASRDFSLWGTPTFGRDYDRVLGQYLRAHTRAVQTVGGLAHPAGGTNPSTGFTILRLAAG